MPHPALEEFQRVAALLLSDIETATQLHKEAASDFTRRTLIKTLFTYLEGHLYAFKQAILALEEVLAMPPPSSRMKSRLVLFTDEDRAMLEEYTYDLSSSGHARKQAYRPRLTENIKFTVDVFYRAIKIDPDINFNSTGWNNLLAAQRIRNRLTHPKSLRCLEITDTDIDVVDAGIRWYEETTDHMLDRFQQDSIFAPRFK